MDNHTEVPDLSARYDDAYRRLSVNRKETAMRLNELHAEGVPSLDDILKATKHVDESLKHRAALREARKNALSRDEGYQRMLSDRSELLAELYKLGDELLLAQAKILEERRMIDEESETNG